MKEIIKILILIFFATIETASYARFLKEEEAYSETELTEELYVNKDGSYEKVFHVSSKILKDQERDDYVPYRMQYTKDVEELEIIEAKTLYEGIEYHVPQDQIEDKPLATYTKGFDEERLISISFPKVAVGSHIYLTIKATKKIPPVKGMFSMNFYFGFIGKLIKKQHMKITSEIPLYLKIYDPYKILKVTNKKNKNHNIIEFSLKKPMLYGTLNEPSNNRLNAESEPWISVSSINNWSDFAMFFSPRYNEIFKQELPDLFNNILKEAEKQSDDVNKINFVVSSLIDKINYMGDWRSVEGAYFPRALKDIALSQTGDCKDISAVCAAILTKLGFKVNFVLVDRGYYVGNIHEKNLPSFIFNHVFLKVTNKEGRVFWVDPTNHMAMADGIFSDVADKMVLVLDIEKSSYERTPDIDFNSSLVKIKEEVDCHNNKGYCLFKGVSQLSGEIALPISSLIYYNTKQAACDRIFHLVNTNDIPESNKISCDFKELKTKAVEPIKIEYAFKQKDVGIITNLGIIIDRLSQRYPAINSLIYDLTNFREDQENDLFIGEPVTIESSLLIKNILIEAADKIKYFQDTPYFLVSLDIKNKDGDTEILEKIVIKKSLIPNKDLKNLEPLMKDIKKYFRDSKIIIPHQ